MMHGFNKILRFCRVYFFSKRFIDKGYMVNFAQGNRFLKAVIETTY